MYRATIHTDLGESFRVLSSLRDPRGKTIKLPGGKALLAFIEALESYHNTFTKTETDGTDKDAFQWFVKLEETVEEPISDITRLLIQSWYVGQYTWNEYSLLSERDSRQDKRKKWQHMSEEIDKRWVDVVPLLGNVTHLLKILMASSLEATWWYEPNDTLPDFQALVETLTLAKERGAEKVIIQFA